MPLFKDYTGTRFANLVVLNKHRMRGKHRQWLCQCDCGNKKYMSIDGMQCGRVKSCGCIYQRRKDNYGRSTINKVFTSYKRNARKANRDFTLSKENFIALTQMNCFYCGMGASNFLKSLAKNGDYTYNGIDRKDNSKGYTLENSLPCCWDCNRMKRDIDYDDFLRIVTRIYNNVQEPKRKYSLFIGRWQCLPPHKGHLSLIGKVLEEGKNALIAVRDTPIDEKNPYSVLERINAFEEVYKKEIAEGRVKIMKFPDVHEVCYGRDPGWKVREIRLDEETEKISGTEIRKSLQSNKNK